MHVRVYGFCRPLDAIEAIADRHGVPLIVDAAALGGRSSGGQRVGAAGTVEVFSLHATKVFGIGEGGVAFASPEIAAHIRRCLNFGLDGGRIASLGQRSDDQRVGIQQQHDLARMVVAKALGGVFGYGTAQEYLLFDDIGPKLQPDLVLLFFCHCNDNANNNYRLELIDGDLSRALKPYFDYSDDDEALRLIPPPPPSPRTSLRERLRDWSLLYNVIETGVVYKFELQNPQEALNGIDGLPDPTRGKYDAKPSGEWERSWRITDAVIEKLRDRVESVGVRLVLVGIPGWRGVDRAYWQRDSNKRLVDSGRGGSDAQMQLLDQIARRLNVPHLDLRSTLQSYVDADGLQRYYIEEDYHWTADGNAVAAEAVGAFLQDRGLVPR